MALYNKQVSALGSTDYRVYFYKDGHPISPFHDIPLWADKEKGIANMVVEIPLGTRPKLEISRDAPLNPIKQDVKKGALRYVHDPYPFNYGAFPQTWESPFVVDPNTQAKGDNDPLDVVEISGKPRKTGDVVQVKILGTYAMIDEGETDWKIVTIDVNDPLAAQLNEHSDIPKEVTEKVFTFLRDYKIPDGNPPNKFAFNNELKDRAFALKVTHEIHEQWVGLIRGDHGDKAVISLTALENGKKISPADAEAVVVSQFKSYLQNKL
uniref:inorganic diphosphatase n=1 Tax=Arcella intermedia TaxID=1963864 RepID=A0A6B2LE42_9EUKA